MLGFWLTLLTLVITSSGKSLKKASLTRKVGLLREIKILLWDELPCRQDFVQQQSNAAKNAIYINGIVYTVDETNWDQTPKDSFVVQNGKIVSLGPLTMH